VSVPDSERVCAALAPLIAEPRRKRIDQILEARLAGLTIVLERLHDPHNGAAALRSCEAAGVGVIHVVESAERFRFSEKVTQGCERWLELHRHRDTAAAVAALRAHGFRLAAAVPGATATLDDLDARLPTALWFGNEHDGLSSQACAAADVAFGLPLFGMTRSLNLSVAVALALFRAAERRRAALGQPGDLDATVQAGLRARWYREEIRGADAVLRRAGILRP
jgi:tRNA (guanosine-2'-O-)-methyltransferase